MRLMRFRRYLKSRRQIEVHGDYSTDQAGTYTLTYTAMDSDGNVSAPVTLELVVKG